MFYLDWTIILLIPALILGIYAQTKVSSTYRRYREVNSMKGYTGYDVARKMLDDNNLQHIEIVETPGEMTDHYDPRSGVVRLSHDVYHGTSISALGIAAHEIGHAIQDSHNYAPLRIRNAIVPVTNFGNFLYLPLLILGLIMSSPALVQWGIILFALIVAFQMITLPVEFDASHRAIVNLEADGFLNEGEIMGAKKVLGAAALTYVAAAVTAIAQLLRLIIIFGGQND